MRILAVRFTCSDRPHAPHMAPAPSPPGGFVRVGKIRRLTITMGEPQPVHSSWGARCRDERADGQLEHPQAQQRKQPLAVRMQKAKVTRPAKAFGQHMLHEQPQEGSPADGARGPLLGLAVAPAIGEVGLVAILFG